MSITLRPVIPVLRMFDEVKTREFYVGFLGFHVVFEHRFGDDFPLYMGIRRSNVTLHLSEHHGDCAPGAMIRIGIDDVGALALELSGKDYRYAKPGWPQRTEWGSLELTLTDPSANRLVFHQTL